ncbi:CocE/NonD family hydrolase [Nocardioides nitrophenolicus]|uniref:CocE/NonD family hydrolase n=1 Tax=Nocardioides nitrophenolicus TaxID=60489 RepID=UPI00195D7D2F|nr:CocE/NonD family hydrolase [Nocardioides nitrophenolicus]MBM7518435.1 putative acyl esterase [Nocardioides nitrophenolicus]
MGRLVLALCLAVAGLGAWPQPARADGPAPVVVEQRFTTSDGVQLQTTLTSTGPVTARPTVVEFSPYGDGSQTLEVTPDYNYLLVQIRGTGDSDGSFDALGPASQRDVVEVLRWACDQPFSDGRLALNGFSASAIVLYNSWHQQLPCVKAAIMKSGTHELYRDLLVPGGILNLVPGAGVIGMIGAPALLQGVDRLRRDPASSLDVVGGLFASGTGVLAHPTLDSWWAERGWRGDANDIPVLMVNGFYDVESRGAFQAYQALKDDGAHLVMEGGHDGVPVGSDGAVGEAHAWLDHYVRGVDNGIEATPRVSLLLAKGSRAAYLAGEHVRREAADWPVPGTTWTDLALGPGRALTLDPPAAPRTASYLTVPSLPTMTDVPNAAILEAGGASALTGALPLLAQTNLAGIDGVTGLTYTTDTLTADVDLAGPLALDLALATTTPGSGIWAVLSDVAPDGTSNPLTVGRLSTSFPGLVPGRSLSDDQGRVVQPYGDYTHRSLAPVGQFRRYQVELWPVGNRFRAGHRIRIQLVGTSAASLPSLPGLHTIRLGGTGGAVLRVPVLPGSDLGAALR